MAIKEWTQERIIDFIERMEPNLREHIPFYKEKGIASAIGGVRRLNTIITHETFVYLAKSLVIKEDRSVNDNRDSLLNAFYENLSTEEFEEMIHELDDEYKVLIDNKSFIHTNSDNVPSHLYWDETFKEEDAVLKEKIHNYISNAVMYLLLTCVAVVTTYIFVG